jgi:ubiquitin-protein ligase
MDDSFDIKFTRGSVIGHWDFIKEIPLFLNIAQIGKRGWDKRLKEEFEKLEYVKKLKKDNILFTKVEQDPKNPRIFYVEGNSEMNEQIKFILRLPMRYPFVPPYAEEYYYGKYAFYSYSDHGKVACLDKINNRWDSEGRHGIAHFLAMLGYYTALARHNVNLSTIKRSRKKSK